jgi:hypothetical protein
MRQQGAADAAPSGYLSCRSFAVAVLPSYTYLLTYLHTA